MFNLGIHKLEKKSTKKSTKKSEPYLNGVCLIKDD